uniref:Guanine nucleotide-binding protein G(Q) subunit alpha n=1 Tax=Syphacia muris TaxID=451379 RepID=A0A0N5AY95_9BILA
MGLKCCKTDHNSSDGSDDEELIRFFMVGMGGAGKSTVIRQLMKLCYDCPNLYKLYDSEWNEKSNIHSEGDLRKWKITIQQNILEAFCNTIKQSRLFGFEFNEEQSGIVAEIESLCDDVRTLHLRRSEWSPLFNEQLGKKLSKLIASNQDPIKCTLMRCQEFAAEYRLPDGVDNFITEEKITYYAKQDTVPDEDDIVHARDPTSGLDYYHFLVHKMRIQIHDMGGQMIERTKILEYLSHWLSDSKPNYRNFILYVVSIADYNVKHPNRTQYTLLDESEPVSIETLRKAIANKFAKEISNNAVKRRSPVFHKFTCAVDSKMMENLFGTIRSEIILKTIIDQDWAFP